MTISDPWLVTLLPLGLLQAGALVWILATLKTQMKRALEELADERKHIAVLNDETGQLAERMATLEGRTSSLQGIAQRMELILLRLDVRSDPRS
jgi:cell division protein FtsB